MFIKYIIPFYGLTSRPNCVTLLDDTHNGVSSPGTLMGRPKVLNMNLGFEVNYWF